MSEPASLSLVDDERAEFGVSALMFLSVVLVSTSILSTFLLSIAERTMVDGRETAHSQADVVNGIISVTYIEISALNDPGGGDQLHMGFEFPYLVGEIPDTAVRWVLMCSTGTGNLEEVAYTTGDFAAATSVTDDGATVGSLEQFDSSGVYHMFMVINAATGDCDLDANSDAQLVIGIEKGRTFQTRIQLGSSPSVGDQLL